MGIRLLGTELDQLLEKHRTVIGALRNCFSFQIRCSLSKLQRLKAKFRTNFALLTPEKLGEGWAKLLSRNIDKSLTLPVHVLDFRYLLNFETRARHRRLGRKSLFSSNIRLVELFATLYFAYRSTE